MKITVLVENTIQKESETIGLRCEHGLSFFIEFQGKNYLLDAGTSDLFMENAKLLHIPIFDTTTCILSHGHYDHSGGFDAYLRENKNAKLYMMNDATKEYYSGSGGVIHEIGIPKKVIEEHCKRFIFVEDMRSNENSKRQEGKIENEVVKENLLWNKKIQIEKNVYIVPHNTSNLEQIGAKAKLYVKENGTYLPDDFSHELSLVFDTQNGLVVLNSCSHGGIKNILREVQEALPNQKVYAFLGGLHMKGKREGIEICTFSEEEIYDLVSYVKEIGMKYLYTGHCTGEIGLQLLKKYGGEIVGELTTGKSIQIE